MKKITAKEAQLFSAMFDGKSISMADGAKIARHINQRNRILIKEFSLSQTEIQAMVSNPEKVRELAKSLVQEQEVRVKAKVNELEQKALKRMRDLAK